MNEEFKRIPELEKQIDAYVKGKLNFEQTEDFWLKMMEHPHYLEYLKLEVAIHYHHNPTFKDYPAPGAEPEDPTPDTNLLNEIINKWSF